MEALRMAKPTPGKDNQFETRLEDGTIVLFRRDIGELAHPIGKSYNDPVDHYNIEVHIPNPTKPGKFVREQNMHIIVDRDFSPVKVFFKNESCQGKNPTNKLK